MKKILLTITTLTFIMVACTVDLYDGKRPIDQNNTTWKCDTLDIYFEVSDKHIEKTGGNTYGSIEIDGRITEIIVIFDYGTGVMFMPIDAYHNENSASDSYIDSEAFLFKGLCEYKSDKMLVEITDNSKGFLDMSIEELVFYKT